MRILYFLFVFAPALLWGQRYQLAAPHIVVDSLFFKQSAKVQLDFDLEGASVSYTVDGTFPVGKAPVYTKPFTVNQSTLVRAKSVHPDFLPSQIVEQQLIQVSAVPDSFRLLTPPDSAYSGKGAATLFDLQKAGADLHSGRWLGFKGDTVVLEVYFKKKVKNRILTASTLFDSGAWIFPPAGIEVFGANGNEDWMPLGVWTAKPDVLWKDKPARYAFFQRVVMRSAEVDRLRIRIIPYGPLPAWHSGSGHPAWLFLDEIVFQ